MPKTIVWFRAYCGLLAFLYLLLMAGGIAILVIPAENMGMQALEARVVGGLFIGMGLIFFFISLMGFYLPRRSGGWTCGLILICIGLTSAIFLPVCIPLLIFWRKPEIQQWFGRNVS
tara:strand:- start:4882 stop:5232 length:351 start_codon:yes stop_codon:yes gene_type:complete